MQHQYYEQEFLVTLQKLYLYATKSEIRILTTNDQKVLINSGTFSVTTPNSLILVSNHLQPGGKDSGFIDITARGSDADIVLDANTGPTNASFLTVNTKGILSAFGNPSMPAFIRLDSNGVHLGKGPMPPKGPTGGKITLTETSVILQAGASKLSITPTGIVMQLGPTKIELSIDGIVETAATTKHTLSSINGHVLETTGSELKITPANLDIKAPIVKVNADASLKYSGVLIHAVGDAILDIKGALKKIS